MAVPSEGETWGHLDEDKCKASSNNYLTAESVYVNEYLSFTEPFEEAT